jgi:hypothetical protein
MYLGQYLLATFGTPNDPFALDVFDCAAYFKFQLNVHYHLTTCSRQHPRKVLTVLKLSYVYAEGYDSTSQSQ